MIIVKSDGINATAGTPHGIFWETPLWGDARVAAQAAGWGGGTRAKRATFVVCYDKNLALCINID